MTKVKYEDRISEVEAVKLIRELSNKFVGKTVNELDESKDFNDVLRKILWYGVKVYVKDNGERLPILSSLRIIKIS
jgi:hypothetical protein